MSDNARDFGLFIDGLRIDRNISREDLTEGIISLSQYKRYLRGAASIPNSILIMIADRLKFSISGLHQIYQAKQDSQYSKVLSIYSLIKQLEYEKAYEKAKLIRDEIFLSNFNKLFFDFCFISIQYNLSMASDIHVLDKYSQLIDYPNCLKNDSFNWIEINILLDIVRISSKVGNFEPSDQMYKIVTSPTFKYISSGDSSFIPVVFVTLATLLEKQEKYDEALIIIDEGIRNCRRFQTSTSLASLFMTKAFVLNDTQRKDEAIKSARKALMQLYIENNTEKYNHYLNAFKTNLETSEEILSVK